MICPHLWAADRAITSPLDPKAPLAKWNAMLAVFPLYIAVAGFLKREGGETSGQS